MAAPAIPYSTSAGLPFGAGTLTPTTGNYVNNTYILNRFEINEPLTVIDRLNVNGGPNGAVAFQEARTATGQLQLATSNATDTLPEAAAEFVRTERGTNVTFFFTRFGVPQEIRSFWVVDFEAREKV